MTINFPDRARFKDFSHESDRESHVISCISRVSNRNRCIRLMHSVLQYANEVDIRDDTTSCYECMKNIILRHASIIKLYLIGFLCFFALPFSKNKFFASYRSLISDLQREIIIIYYIYDHVYNLNIINGSITVIGILISWNSKSCNFLF